jgi:hypothetical protein
MKKKILVSMLLVLVSILGCVLKPKKAPSWLDALILLTFGSNTVLTSLNGQAIDSGSGQLITTTVNYSLSGTAKNYIRDLNGNKLDSFSSSIGFLTLFIDPAAPINTSEPLRLMISANADGYLSNNVEIIIDKQVDFTFLVPMVNINSPPSGASIKQFNLGSASNGVLSNAISIATDAESQTNGTAGLSMSQGTIIRDANGQPLEGSLKATVAYFNNKDDNSLLSFPGGLSPNIASDEKGQATDGIFVTGGFTAIEIADEKGKRAKNFSQKTTVSIDIPSGTINPETKLAVKEGDKFPIWSLDNNTGKWKFEGNGNVTVNGTNFKASVETDHLSYYNMDWFGARCTTNQIKILGDRKKLSTINLVIRAKGGVSFIRHKTISTNEDTFGFYNAPRAMPLTITAFVEGVEIGKIDIDDLCDFRKAEFPITVPASIKLVDLDTSLNLNCRSCDSGSISSPISSAVSSPVYNKNPINPANVYMYYYDKNCSGGWSSGCTWQYGGRFSRDGKMKLRGVKAGKKYELYTFGYFGFPPYFFSKKQEAPTGETNVNSATISVDY